MATQPTLAMIPSGYKDGKLYSVLPSDGVGDFDVTRGSNATRINKDGLIETVTGNTPRLDYTDGSCPSLLLEPLATNVIVNSNTPNSSSNVVVNTNNSISPDGSLNAFKLTANSGTSLKLVDVNGTSSGTYRFSVFAKKDTYNIIQLGGGGIVGHANFNLETGEYSSNGSMDYYGNGWYRCTVQFSAGIPISHYVSFSDSLSANRLSTSVSTGSFFLYGMQSETTSFTTSYIPTTSSAVTRLADTANNAGNASTFNDSEGVLMVEMSALADDATYKSISISDGSSANQLWAFYYSNNIRFIFTVGGVAQADISYSGSNVTLFNKIAIKWGLNDFKLYVNGIKRGEDGSGVVPLQGVFNRLNFKYSSGADYLYGKVKDLRVYKTALTALELETLTSYTSFNAMALAQNYKIQ